MTVAYQTAAEVLDQCHDDILSGTPPVLYPIGTGDLARLEVGPGLVTLLGGRPRGWQDRLRAPGRIRC